MALYISNATDGEKQKVGMVWVTEHWFGEHDILIEEFLYIPNALL